MKPTLSLCIPTYNRQDMLAGTLASILDSADNDVRSRIEIVISDNGSSDRTAEIVGSVIQANPDCVIRYHRHAENRGSDANIMGVMGMARNDFVLVVSDDDIVTEGALSHILNVLESTSNPDLLCLNLVPFTTRDGLMTPLHDIECDTPISTMDEILAYLDLKVSFISAIAFKREIEDVTAYSQYIGTNFCHSYFFLNVIRKAKSAIALASPSIAFRADNVGGYNVLAVFITSFDNVLMYAATLGYNKELLASLKSRNLALAVLPAILTAKVSGAVGGSKPNYVDVARRLLSKYARLPYTWFVVMPCLAVPSWAYRAAKACRNALRLVTSRHRGKVGI